MLQKQLPWLASIALLLSACATHSGGTMTAHPNATPEGDIAAIVMAANEGEVEQGKAAADRATNDQVKAFARMMVADHTTAIANARSTFDRAGVNPSDNNIAGTLRRNSQTTVTNLNTYSGREFDRMYMQTQVDLHAWLLRSLDEALIPSTVTPELRTLLQTQRGAVAMHLEQARSIHAGL
ncbi:MAG TPA: DUF4142 domain-containing protein [Thermoanaerobaculia bacterium]